MAGLVGFWSGRLVRLFLGLFVIGGEGGRGRVSRWRLRLRLGRRILVG